jgi:hypothetical protein
MRPNTRALFVIVFGLPVLVALPLVLLGNKLYSAGNVEVHVIEKGPEGGTVDVRVPASLVPIAVGLGTACRIEGCDLDEDARKALRVADAVIGAMAGAPDGVFVDIRDRDEVVRIEKAEGVLRVHVDSADAVVHASVPLGAVRSALSLI